MYSLPQSPALFCLDVRDQSRPSAVADHSISSWCCPKCKRPLSYQPELGFFAHYTGAPLCPEANQIGLQRFIEHILEAALSPKKVTVAFSPDTLELTCEGRVLSTSLSAQLQNPEQAGYEDEVLKLVENLLNWLKKEEALAGDETSHVYNLLAKGKEKPIYAHENEKALTSDRFNPDDITILELVETKQEGPAAQIEEVPPSPLILKLSELRQQLQSKKSVLPPSDLKTRMRAVLTSDWVKKSKLSSADIASLRDNQIDLKGIANPMEGWWAILWLDSFIQGSAQKNEIPGDIELLLEEVILRCELLTESVEEVRLTIGKLLAHASHVGLIHQKAGDSNFSLREADAH